MPESIQSFAFVLFRLVTKCHYSDGLKLRMPHPFSSRCPKECRRGGKILKNPGKILVKCNFRVPVI